MVFGGGSGTRAPGSITMSPMQAAGLPPIRVTPVPPPPPGVVIPGPCGVPEQAGGGAFGIVQVCWSVSRQAGFPPISTVVQAAPISGEPCIVESPSRAAGRPMLDVPADCLRLDDALQPEDSPTQQRARITRIHALQSIRARKRITASGDRANNGRRAAARILDLELQAALHILRADDGAAD